MKLHVANSLPTRLEPVLRTIAGALDPVEDLRTTVLQPLLTPLNGQTAVVTDDQGSTLDEDQLLGIAQRCLTGVVDADAEASILHLAKLAVEGMRQTDKVILDIMMEKQGKHAAPP